MPGSLLTELSTGETVALPLSKADLSGLADEEIIRIAVNAFLRISEVRGAELDAGAMAAEINEQTGVGYGAAMLVASSSPRR